MSTSPHKRQRTSSPSPSLEPKVQAQAQTSMATSNSSVAAGADKLPSASAAAAASTSKLSRPRNPKGPKGDKDRNTSAPSSTSAAAAGTPGGTSPYIPLFTTFRRELDTHHDRRESVIKASRDITANAKKMIFTLQRHQPQPTSHSASLPASLPPAFSADLTTRESAIKSLLRGIYPCDLHGLNNARYARQLSPGMQEYVEMAVFRHYLLTGQLLGFLQARAEVRGLLADVDADAEAQGQAQGDAGDAGDLLTVEDYILGVFDAVGEMMRWGITHLALLRGAAAAAAAGTDGSNGSNGSNDLVTDLRSLRTALETLDLRGSGLVDGGGGHGGGGGGGDIGKKMDVMRACVEKVENAVYGAIVRGAERPEGWVPDSRDVDVGGGDERERW